MTATTTARPATARQVDYVRDLMTGRVGVVDGNTDPEGRSVATILEAGGVNMNAFFETLTFALASDLITKLQRQPRVARQPRAHVDAPVGIHRVGEVIFKVYITRQAQRPAAKRLTIVDDGNGRFHGEFTYEAGAIRRHNLSNDTLLSHEEAARFGSIYKFCCACGAVLETEESLHAGYGPTCARNHGWPWGTRQRIAVTPAEDAELWRLADAGHEGAREALAEENAQRPDDVPMPDYYMEGPTCPICDALGHGVPGTPPCPLEDSGRYDDDERYYR